MAEQWIELLFWLVMASVAAFVVFCFVMGIRNYTKHRANGGKFFVVPEYVEPVVKTVKIKATVIDQACRVRMAGLQMPKTVKEFVIVFQTERGEVLKLNVPEMLYDGFQRGQSGMLTTVDGELYSFEPD